MVYVWLCILDPLQLQALDSFTSVERASCPACIQTDPVAHTAKNSKSTRTRGTSTLIQVPAPSPASLESTLRLRARIYSLFQKSKARWGFTLRFHAVQCSTASIKRVVNISYENMGLHNTTDGCLETKVMFHIQINAVFYLTGQHRSSQKVTVSLYDLRCCGKVKRVSV